MNETFKGKRDFTLDIMKCIAMFFVVYYHLGKMYLDYSATNQMSNIWNYLLSFTSMGVPIFFFVNGALLLNKKEMCWEQWIWKIIKTFFLIITWSIIIELYMFWFKQTFEKEDFWFCILNGTNLNYLWFLKSLLIIYTFFPILWMSKNYANQTSNNLGIAIYIIILLIAAFGNNLLLMAANVIRYLKQGILFNGNGEYKFFTLFLPDLTGGGYRFPIAYFLVGGFIYQKKLNIHKGMCLLFIGMGTLTLTYYGYICSKAMNEYYNVAGNSYSSIIVLFCVICTYYLIRQVNFNGKIISYYINLLGQNTLGVYFLHIPVGYSLSRTVSKIFKLHLSGFLIAIIYCIIVLNISLLISVIAKRIPILKYLF